MNTRATVLGRFSIIRKWSKLLFGAMEETGAESAEWKAEVVDSINTNIF